MKRLSLVIALAEGRAPEYPDALARDPDLEVVCINGPNPSRNRNEGARRATAPLIGFINGHTRIAPDWSARCFAFLEQHPEIDLVGGPQLTEPSENPVGRASGYAMESLFGAACVRRRYCAGDTNLDATETDLTSANLVCRRHVLDRVQFDESLYPGEDPKFIADARAAGLRVAFTPDMVVYNRRRPTLVALAAQIFLYGRVRPHKESFAETLCRPYFLVPSLFLIYVVVLPALLPWLGGLAAAPLALYAGLALGWAAFLALRHRDPVGGLLLPAVFLIIHLSYGAGYLRGLLDRPRRRTAATS